MPSLNHIHKYERAKQGDKKRIIHVCRLPNCTHFLDAVLIIGKESICWRCPKTFIITAQKKDFKRPYCDDHVTSKLTIEKEIPSENVDDLLKSLGVK